jgi:hypothetical protein
MFALFNSPWAGRAEPMMGRPWAWRGLCSSDIIQYKNSCIFQCRKKLRVDFLNLEFDLSSAESKPCQLCHVPNQRRRRAQNLQ